MLCWGFLLFYSKVPVVHNLAFLHQTTYYISFISGHDEKFNIWTVFLLVNLAFFSNHRTVIYIVLCWLIGHVQVGNYFIHSFWGDIMHTGWHRSMFSLFAEQFEPWVKVWDKIAYQGGRMIVVLDPQMIHRNMYVTISSILISWSILCPSVGLFGFIFLNISGPLLFYHFHIVSCKVTRRICIYFVLAFILFVYHHVYIFSGHPFLLLNTFVYACVSLMPV